MRERWHYMTKTERFLRAGQILFSLLAILAAALQLSGLWAQANHLATPSMGLVILLQSFAEWKKNRVTAVFGFLASAGVFIMFGIGIFLQLKGI